LGFYKTKTWVYIKQKNLSFSQRNLSFKGKLGFLKKTLGFIKNPGFSQQRKT